MTSASDELRAAAAKIRDLASRVPHGPWHVELGKNHRHPGYPQRISNPEATLIAETFTSPEFKPAEAEYIALMHPGVGTLLADWLEDVAKFWDGLNNDADEWTKLPTKIRDELRTGPWDAEHALAIARSINGTPTPEAGHGA